MSETGEACACLTVQFKPKEHDDGSKTERWACRDCGREFRPAAPLEPSAESARHLQLLATMEAMRRLGVTRYRSGEVEIELAPAASDTMTKLTAWPYAGIPANVGKCLKSVAMGLCAREHGHSGLCSRDGETPPSDPPDEQPAVEIDYAATEELLRAQDARRRGQHEAP